MFSNTIINNVEKYDLFTLNDYKVNTKIIHIHDGDTFTCLMSLPPDNFDKNIIYNYDIGKIYEWRCRLKDINTAELNSKDPDQILLAKEQTQMLINYVNNAKKLVVECGKWDKYGRVLVNLLIDNINYSNILLEKYPESKYKIN